MQIDIVTLFPEMFHGPFAVSMVARAVAQGLVSVNVVPLRPFGVGEHRLTDDYPYGGGPGMVMLAEPLERALAAVTADRAEAAPVVIHFSPTGRRLDQALVQSLAVGTGAILLCGR